jgi:hypothetical protein
MNGVPFLGIADNGLMTRQDIVVVHTIVGFQSGGNAAHWTTGAGGKIVQARDTRYCSAANLHGNWHCLAIENEDHGPAYEWVNGAPPPFTAAQLEAIAKILAWCHKVHGIPLVLVPDSKVGRRGIAYHRQGIDGNFPGPYHGRVAGGELWSSSRGKVCPGDKRITQLIKQIIPRARVLAGMEDDVTEADKQDIILGVLGYKNEAVVGATGPDVYKMLHESWKNSAEAEFGSDVDVVNQGHIFATEADVNALRDDVSSVKSQLAQVLALLQAQG